MAPELKVLGPKTHLKFSFCAILKTRGPCQNLRLTDPDCVTRPTNHNLAVLDGFWVPACHNHHSHTNHHHHTSHTHTCMPRCPRQTSCHAAWYVLLPRGCRWPHWGLDRGSSNNYYMHGFAVRDSQGLHKGVACVWTGTQARRSRTGRQTARLTAL